MEDKSISTEEKIKAAARTIFTRKGYAATKTRDIAEEAGLNLALLNYYFRSKEKLFEIIMAENLKKLFGILAPILNDSSKTLEEKLASMAANYIDMLFQNPDLPLFVLSELRQNPGWLRETLHVDNYVLGSHLMVQLKEKKPAIDPVQFLMSFLGMLIFPFAARPILQGTAAIDDAQYNQLMEERKKLVPMWMKCMLE
ncbi:TetR/AcrR family transcriptional regulator [Chitinophaga sancti]|uniref:TetR family transcriptional regulator n=1 Tax=Chitinophaga sancti TaxID=1004 RepID=A0A1K1S4W7_9BACT|nr:TetR family transcriptional regulator [Chitinophaga sancti]WQD63753.1 TetR family transcriptional regulator [Chitinophaga sancti]WQG90622.1 TetR family transcriptional regulator [Chitinophaga sancti]SFW79061.1 transcriptional regulator, TetR family [Chitinophaga sancti]